MIFRAIVRRNLEAMIAMAGGADRLRPHVKTHKMPGDRPDWASRWASTSTSAPRSPRPRWSPPAGGRDVLLAYPLVGPNVARLAPLVERYPETTFRATGRRPRRGPGASEAMRDSHDRPLPVLVDLDVGMGRTGIAPGDAAGSSIG